MRSARVSTTPDVAPSRDRYDVVVVGAGVLGAAVAALLRRWAPSATLLLVEEAGIPNEGGASVASPGLLPPVDGAVPGGSRAALRWVERWVDAVLPGAAGLRAGWLELAPPAAAAPASARALDRLVAADIAAAVTTMTGVARDHPATLRQGGYVAADALAVGLSREAVHAGADLALNARARPLDGSRLVLERLALDRRMRVGVHAYHEVRAEAVVVACGAAGAEVAEAGLDRPVRLASAYRQFPRVRLTVGTGAVSTLQLPVVTLGGWAFRRGPGGAVLVPPRFPADPAGYQPTGGRMLGVPVGLRRELLDRLLDAPEMEGLVASGRLDLGKSVRSVRGGRFSAPVDGGAVARPLGEGWWLLAGGEQGLLSDLVAAARLAASVAGVTEPW